MWRKGVNWDKIRENKIKKKRSQEEGKVEGKEEKEINYLLLFYRESKGRLNIFT